MMGIMMILVGTCLMASRAWGSEVRAIVGSVTLALFFAILGVLLIEGPESGLPRFTASNPVHALVVAISLYIPALIVNRMEPGVFEWDKEARVFEESDGEDEKLTTTTGDDSRSTAHPMSSSRTNRAAPSPGCWPGSRTTTPCSGCGKIRRR